MELYNKRVIFMYISPIQYNYFNRFYTGRGKSSVKFTGEAEDKNTARVLSMLSLLIRGDKGYKFAKDFDDIENIMQKMLKKYNNASVGMLLIPDKALPAFIDGKMHDNHQGVILAIGDNPGPIEQWTSAYEAQVIVCPKSIIDEII